MVELTEDSHHEDIVGGHGVLGIGLEDLLEAGEGAVVVEVVEVVVGVADYGVEVEGVGVGVGCLGQGCGGESCDESEGEESLKQSQGLSGSTGDRCVLGEMLGVRCFVPVRLRGWGHGSLAATPVTIRRQSAVQPMASIEGPER